MNTRLIKTNHFIILILLIIFFQQKNLTAQDSQGWFDYNVYYEVNEKVGTFGEAGFRSQFGNQDWRQFVTSGNAFYTVKNWLDVLGGLRYFHTYEKDKYNSNEFRPWVGAKIYLFGFRSMRITNFFRAEYRLVFKTDAEPTDDSFRFRYRFGITMPINRNVLIDNTFYGIADMEAFINTDDGIDETFAERIRLRIGLGYRWTKNWRFEFKFTGQRANSTEDETFEVTDHIYRFSAKHYLNY